MTPPRDSMVQSILDRTTSRIEVSNIGTNPSDTKIPNWAVSSQGNVPFSSDIEAIMEGGVRPVNLHLPAYEFQVYANVPLGLVDDDDGQSGHGLRVDLEEFLTYFGLNTFQAGPKLPIGHASIASTIGPLHVVEIAAHTLGFLNADGTEYTTQIQAGGTLEMLLAFTALND